MYAIISDGGRQLKVEQGQELLVDFRDIAAGEKITFDRVMAVSDGSGDLKLGAPMVSGASVVAEVLGPEKGPKVTVQKMRRRKNFRKKTGFRGVHTKIRISSITS